MSDLVTVPQGDSAGDTATLLLEAAEKKGHDPSVVTVKSHGSEGLSYEVPADVAKAAGVEVADDGPSLEQQVKADEKEQAEVAKANPVFEQPESDDSPAPAKKTAAKKTAKKTTAKKTTAKKTAKK